MKAPNIDLIPLRAAVSSVPTTLDVLVRIILPVAKVEVRKTMLNISLVGRRGLMAATEDTAILEIEPQAGVEVVAVLNDLDFNRKSRYQLSHSLTGNPIEAMVRLSIPAMAQAVIPSYKNMTGMTEKKLLLCYFYLTWKDPEQQRQEIRTSLQLPIVSSAQMEEIPLNQEVRGQLILMIVARAKQAKKAALHLAGQREYEAASLLLQKVRELVLFTLKSPLIEQEAADLAALDAELKSRQHLTSNS